MIPAVNVRTLLPWGLLVLGGIALLLWLSFVKPSPPEYIPGPTSVRYVPVPKKVLDIQKELVPIQGALEFFPKEKVAEKLKIDVREVPDNVVGVGEVPPHTGKTTVLASLAQSDNTYRINLSYRQEPPPFFAIKKDLGIRGGYGSDGFVGEIYARPLRVGPVTIETRAFGRSDPSDFGVAIMLDYRF